jgi:hypothetical protein
MFGRFLIPITPLLYLGSEFIIYSIKSNLRNTSRWTAIIIIATGISLPVLTAFRFDPFKTDPVYYGIVQEHKVYKRQLMEYYSAFYKEISLPFRELKLRIAIDGGFAYAAYALESPLVIEASNGLTDEFIAHQKITERKRIAHEKPAPVEYLEGRKIHLHTGLHTDDPWRKLSVTHDRFKDTVINFTIITYDTEKMDSLKKYKTNGLHIQFMNFQDYLDHTYFPGMNQKSYNIIKKDYEHFKIYYFNHNYDPGRESIFTERLRYIQ